MSMFRRRKDDSEAADDPLTPEAVLDESGSTPRTVGVPAHGPLDAGDVESTDGRLDLGSLWVPGVEGMELRLELDQDGGQVVAATVVLGESALQLQAFAAPKSSGIWDEIRPEISAAVVQGGGSAREQAGEWGKELATRMPSAGPGGKPTLAPARFIGIDGPRWFLRAVLSGPAATANANAEPLLGVLRATVVHRGSQPMAPRELLPLHLPEAATAQPAADEPGAPDLNPFERGPEITEVH